MTPARPSPLRQFGRLRGDRQPGSAALAARRSTSSSSAAASRAPAWRSTRRRAATRVALVEKADFASGTSSRSSKLVHGGLRYLQNFDLGLVREALLERQLMVKLAPHLVRPLPLVVPAFDGARPDRLVGIGLNLYDVMARATSCARRRKRARAERPSPTSAPRLEPRAPPRDPRRRGRRAAAGARRARADLRLPLLRLPDRRRAARADRARRGRALRRRLRQPARGHRARRGGRPGARRRVRDRETGEVFDVRADDRRQRDRRLGRPAAPERAARRGRGAAASAPSRGTHITLAPRATLPLDRRRDRPRRLRALDLRAAVARARR